MLLHAITTMALADCGTRLTAAPLMTPQWFPQLPYGGSVRLDATVYCPPARGSSLAVILDLGAVPVWVYHTGWYPTFRQVVGFQLEPAARGAVPGGPYVTGRLGLTEILIDDTFVSVLPGIVAGYRYEARSGFTAQFGAGVEGWIPPGYSPVWPIVELRAGWAFGGPDGSP